MVDNVVFSWVALQAQFSCCQPLLFLWCTAAFKRENVAWQLIVKTTCGDIWMEWECSCVVKGIIYIKSSTKCRCKPTCIVVMHHTMLIKSHSVARASMFFGILAWLMTLRKNEYGSLKETVHLEQWQLPYKEWEMKQKLKIIIYLDPCLCDWNSLLLHSFMNSDLIFGIHLVKFIYTTNTLQSRKEHSWKWLDYWHKLYIWVWWTT